MSIPYAQILFGKYLIQTDKPEMWLGMEGMVLALAETLRCRMAAVYAGILTATAQAARGKLPEAAAALKTALDMALPDRLYMPFAENYSLLGSLLEEACPAAERDVIFELAAKLEAGKAAVLRELYPSQSFGLTKREYEVAQLAAQDLTNPQIAAALSIARDTVKMHMKNIYKKTKVSSRHELINFFDEK